MNAYRNMYTHMHIHTDMHGQTYCLWYSNEKISMPLHKENEQCISFYYLILDCLMMLSLRH